MHFQMMYLKYHGPGVETLDDVDDKLHAFSILFNSVLDQRAPVKTIKVSGRPNPCVTDDIREFMKTRNKWHKEARETMILLPCPPLIET